MKKIILLIFTMVFMAPEAFAVVPEEPKVFPPPEPTTGLAKKDEYQAEQWVRLVKSLFSLGDYPLMREYCRKIKAYYPQTHYAVTADKYLKKTNSPKKNRFREWRRSNPALIWK